MSSTMWSFLLLRNGRFIRCPQTRLYGFVNGTESLRHDVGPVAHFIDVALILDNRRPVQAINFWYPRYRLTEDGRVHEEHLWQGMSDAVESVFERSGQREEGVVSIAPYVARNRYKAEHTWKPSVEQLDAAVHAINAAAKADLVTHDGEKLRWRDYGHRP